MSTLATTTVSLTLAAGLAWALAPQEDEATLAESLEARFMEACTEMELDAASVTVAVGDECLLADGFGVLDGYRGEVSADTALPAGELAHAWLTTLVLELRAKGALALDRELGALLPDLVGEGCKAHVAHLLQHTSGLADYTDFVTPEARVGATYAELLLPVRSQPPVSEPGECVADNPTDTLVLAALVERVSGTSAADLLQVRLFERLHMEDSGYDAPERAQPIDASAPVDEDAAPALYPPALRTTARDLLRFQRALVDRVILDSDDFEAMCEPARLADGTHAEFGLGLRLTQAGEAPAFAMGGRDAAVLFVPAHDLTITALAVGADARMDRLAQRLAAEVVEVPPREIVDLYLSRSEMQPYLGSYRIGCNALIVKPGEGRLVLDRIDEGDDALLFQGAHRFVLADDHDVSLTFELEAGRALRFILIDHGRRSEATRFDD
ncbi:MAG: beta-lactamase family protein [Planctomycetes bacterium]|nr:beta-lactamase family protein [Planctomycetota bacterium]